MSAANKSGKQRNEPTTGLDPTSRVAVWEEVRSLNDDGVVLAARRLPSMSVVLAALVIGCFGLEVVLRMGDVRR